MLHLRLVSRRLMRDIFLSLLLAVPALCQPISVGVKVGVPLDRAGQPDDTRTTVDKQRWIAGPTVEVSLPGRFSVGADALYRRLGHQTSRSAGSATFFENSRTNHWEFPIYAKYRFGTRRFQPFVLAGGAFEHASLQGTAGCTGDPMLCGSSAGTHELRSSSWGGGYLAGAGVEFKAGFLKIAPEFRYTRWFRGYFAGAGSNQPAFLLGIRF
jgi:opacity protein-like surface antigen